MKQIKRLLSILLVLAMLAGNLPPAAVFAAEISGEDQTSGELVESEEETVSGENAVPVGEQETPEPVDSPEELVAISLDTPVSLNLSSSDMPENVFTPGESGFYTFSSSRTDYRFFFQVKTPEMESVDSSAFCWSDVAAYDLYYLEADTAIS